MAKKPPPAPRWKPGQSGNPKGRPPGRPDRRRALRDALAEHLPAVVQQVVDQAKAGDLRACELLLSRCLPGLKPVSLPAPFPMPEGSTPTDAARAVVAAVAAGQLAPDVGKALLDGLVGLCRIVEADELERRLAALEQGGGPGLLPASVHDFL